MAANLKAKISLDNSEFTRALDKIHQSIGKTATMFKELAIVAGGAFLAFKALQGIKMGIEGTSGVLELGESLERLHQRTGAPIKDLVILQELFRQSGLSVDNVGPSINRLQKALSGINEDGQPTNKMIERLGLNFVELGKLAPQEQFFAIGKSIADLKSPSERAAAAMAIFGKSGGEMLSIFGNKGGFQAAKDTLGGQADILAKNATAFARVNEVFESIGVRLRGFYVGIAESLLPAFEKVAALITKIDLAGIGQKVGAALADAVNILVNAFQQGKLGALLSLSLKIGVMEAANFIVAIFSGLGNSIVEIMGQSMGILGDPSFWGSAYHGFLSFLNDLEVSFTGLMGRIHKGFRDIFTFMTENLVPGGKGRSWDAIRKDDAIDPVFGKIQQSFQQDSDSEAMKAGDSLYALTQKNIANVDQIISKFLDSAKGVDVFGQSLTDAKKNLNDLAKSLSTSINKGKENSGEIVTGGTTNLGGSVFKNPRAASDLEAIGALMPNAFGSNQNDVISVARDTAMNTKMANVYLSQIVQKLGTNPNSGAVFAT